MLCCNVILLLGCFWFNGLELTGLTYWLWLDGFDMIWNWWFWHWWIWPHSIQACSISAPKHNDSHGGYEMTTFYLPTFYLPTFYGHILPIFVVIRPTFRRFWSKFGRFSVIFCDFLWISVNFCEFLWFWWFLAENFSDILRVASRMCVSTCGATSRRNPTRN